METLHVELPPRHTDQFFDEAHDYNVSSGVLPDCLKIDLNYELFPAVMYASWGVLGVFLLLFGYRKFKLSMSLVGNLFATLIVYKICTVEDLLPDLGNYSVSLGAGILFGSIMMLVQHVGLFVLGFHTGVFAGILGIVTSRLLGSTPDSMWICIGVFIGAGITGSMANLYFQKGFTIIGTCLYGAAFVALAVDFFLSRLKMGHWILSMISLKTPQPVCWFSWLTLGLWPSLFLVGMLTQIFLTGRGIHHERSSPTREPSSLPVVMPGRHSRNFNVQRVRQQDETRAQQQQRKYRYLYQIRTSHGDVISQNCLQSLQKKVLPSGDDSVSMLHGSDHLNQLTVLNPDSAHTTLSHVP